MKKIIILLISLVVVGGLGYYAIKLLGNKGKSDTELIEFAIEDIESVDKIIITDKFSKTIELLKSDGNNWTDENGGCVVQENMKYILEAIKNIEFKGYVPENSLKRYTNMMSSQHIKVEIFQNGSWSKTWYIGPASKDHLGQIMLLDSDEHGKSDFPVVMKIKGHHGIIDARFFTDKRQWACTNIFALDPSKIAKVDVDFKEIPAKSFSVEKKGTKMNVYQQGDLLANVDTASIFRYLLGFKKVHFNSANYELDERQLDSLKKSKPFAVLSVTETNNKTTRLKCYRSFYKVQTEGGLKLEEEMDLDRFWCELPDGTVVKCQYFVFNPLLMGQVFFPLDLSGLTEEQVLF